MAELSAYDVTDLPGRSHSRALQADEAGRRSVEVHGADGGARFDDPGRAAGRLARPHPTVSARPASSYSELLPGLILQ